MIHSAVNKNILLFNTTGATNTTQTASVDTKGFDYAIINVYHSLTAAAAVLKVEQSDDNSTWVSASLTGGTDFTIAANTTASLPYYQFGVDTRGLKRYLKLSVTAGSGAPVHVATAELTRRANGTATATVDFNNRVQV